MIYYLLTFIGMIAFLLFVYNPQLEFYLNLSDTEEKISTDVKSEKKNNIESDKIIVLFKGEKYDITSFAKKHPGGKDILTQYINQEINQLMIDNEHSENAYKILNKYKIIIN